MNKQSWSEFWIDTLSLVFMIFYLTLFFSSTAPMLPPSNVKVTLIEDDTALVSWKSPDETNIAVTHYTILFASRSAWIAGEWQVLQREGKEGNGKRRKDIIQVFRGGRTHKASQTNGPLEISNSFDHPLHVCSPLDRGRLAVFLLLSIFMISSNN